MLQQLQRDTAVRNLLTASRALIGVAAKSLAELDHVTLPQFRALVVLSSRPGTTVTDLARWLDVHPTTATRLTDRLVGKGLARRSPSPEDRRVTNLHLSAKGRRLVDRVTKRRARALAAIVDQIPAHDVGSVARAFEIFARAAGEPTDFDVLGWGAEEPA